MQHDLLALSKPIARRCLVPQRHIRRSYAVALCNCGHGFIFASPDHIAPQYDFRRQSDLAIVGDLQGHIALNFVAARDQEGRPRLNHHTRRNVVGITQIALGHADLFGSVVCLHGCRSDPYRPACQFQAIAFVQIALEYRGLIPRQQDLRDASSQDYRAVDGWIQRLEIVHRHFCHFGCHRHINIAGDGDGLKEGVVFNQGQGGAEALR